MSEDTDNVEHVIETLPDYYDALTGLLNQVQLNEGTKEIILKNYRQRPQEFESSAWRMMNYLTALNVRDNVARFLASRFWSITKNMDLDMFQGMLNPQQSNPYGAGGIAFPPNTNTPSQQYPLPPPQIEDADTKMMRMMMMMKMMNQPATSSSQDPMQQMMQMMMMSGGRMGMSQEPVYLSNGTPATDSNGQQIMRFTMTPSMQQQSVQQGPDPSLELFKEIIKGQNEQKRAADDRYYSTLEKQREMESEIAEKESRALRRRIATVESERSSDRLIEDVEKLRKLGLFTGGGSTPASIDAIRLQTDLDKWKFERETDLSRWQQQTDLEARKWYKEREMEEIRENRTQERLGILGESLKDTLQSVVSPILTSMGSGVAANLQPQTPAAGAAGEVPDLTNISDQDLLNQYQEVERIDNRADEAKTYLKSEMERRMVAKGVEVPTTAPPVKTGLDEASGLDLGSLSDLQFGATPSSIDDDEGYEHAEELAEDIADDALEDYDTEY